MKPGTWPASWADLRRNWKQSERGCGQHGRKSKIAKQAGNEKVASLAFTIGSRQDNSAVSLEAARHAEERRP
jgi:hypothetical protein